MAFSERAGYQPPQAEIPPPLIFSDHDSNLDAGRFSLPKKPTPREGKNVIREQMDAALERVKKADPNFNLPHGVGPIEGTRVDATIVQKAETTRPGESERPSMPETGGKFVDKRALDINDVAQRTVNTAVEKRKALQEILSKTDLTKVGKNLNVAQLEKALKADMELLRNTASHLGMSPEVKDELERQVLVVETMLESLDNIRKNFGKESRAQAQPIRQSQPTVAARRTMPAQDLRQTAPAPSDLRAQKQEQPTKKSWLQKLKFW